MRIDPKQLRYLRAIVEHKTFAPAADVLGLSQPALSRSISELEGEIGTRLLNRGRQGATPTVFGQALAARSEAIDAELRHALPSKIGQKSPRRVRTGASARLS